MTDIILKIILLFTPIAYVPGVGVYKFEMIYFQCSAIALIISAIFCEPKRQFNAKRLMGIFLIINFISVIVNGFNSISMTALINVVLACISVYIVTVYSKNITDCFKWLLVGVGLNAVVWLFQLIGYSPVIDVGLVKGQEGGIMGNAVRFGYLLTLSAPFVSIPLLLIIGIMGICLKELIIVLSVLICLFFKIKRFGLHSNKMMWAIILLFILSLIGIFFYRYEIHRSILLRFRAWQPMLNLLFKRPLLGYGLGTYNLDFGFSSFFQWCYGVGVLGFGFIAICIKHIKWYLIPLLLLCLVEYPFEIMRLWPVLIFVISHYVIELTKEERLC